jgi:hypothetical protein
VSVVGIKFPFLCGLRDEIEFNIAAKVRAALSGAVCNVLGPAPI